MSEKPTIKVGYLKITDHLILGVSQEKIKTGEEKLESCNIETVSFLGWNQVSDAMKSGDVDACFVLAPTAMDLYLSGVKMKLILFAHKTGSVIIKNKLASVNSVKDLKGKIVAIPYQLSVHHMLLHRLLTVNGLEPGAGKDVALEVMAPSQMPQAIQYDDVGEFGGYIVAEPYGSQAILEGFGEELYLSKDLWPKHPCCVLVVRDELIEKHPDAVQEFTDSLVNAGRFVNNNQEETINIGARFLGQPEDVVRNVLSNPTDRVLTTELVPNIDDLSIIQDYMCDNMKLLSGKIDLDKFVDVTFAKNAGAV